MPAFCNFPYHMLPDDMVLIDLEDFDFWVGSVLNIDLMLQEMLAALMAHGHHLFTIQMLLAAALPGEKTDVTIYIADDRPLEAELAALEFLDFLTHENSNMTQLINECGKERSPLARFDVHVDPAGFFMKDI